MKPGEKLINAVFGMRPPNLKAYPNCHRSLHGVSLEEVVEHEMQTLTPRERMVLRLRFGFERGYPMTLERVGKEFGVTRDRIHQIEAKALRRLRHPSRSRSLKDYIYEPSLKERAVETAKGNLFIKLNPIYGEQIATKVAERLQPPELWEAFKQLQGKTSTGIGTLLALSCRSKQSPCLTCGNPTIGVWQFCSKECQRLYRLPLIPCDQCGMSFRRRDSVLVHCLGKQALKHVFCSSACFGKWWSNEKKGRPRRARPSAVEGSHARP